MAAKPTSAHTHQPTDLSTLCLAITEHAPLPMVTMEGAGHIVRYVNPAFCRLMGKPKKELVGKPFAAMMPEKDECLTLLDRVYRTGKPESHTEQQHSKTHPVFWSYTMWPVLADERPVGVMVQVTETAQFHEKTIAMNEALMLGSVRQHELTEASESLNAKLRTEITERKQAATALKESQERYRVLFSALPMAAFVCDRDATIQYYNPRATELWQREPKVGVDQHCGSMKLYLKDGTLLPHAQSPMMEVMRTGIPARNVEMFIERPDGSRLPVIVNFAALKNAQGEIVGAVTSFDDISERKKTEQELSEKARLLDLTKDAIIVCDLQDKVSLWNKGAEVLYGWTFEEVIGKELHLLLQTEFPKPMKEIVAQLHQDGFYTDEVIQIARDGRRIPSLCRWSLDRETKSLLTSYTDITERKQTEEALAAVQNKLADRANQLEGIVAERTVRLQETVGELEAFSYSIAHDMRAPLRAMAAFARLVQTEHSEQLDETGKEYLGRVVSAAQRLDRLVTDVLNYSSVTRRKLDLQPVDLEQLLEEAIRNQPEFQPPRAEIEIQTPLPKVIGHEPSLMQCANNILSNAVKFVLPGVVPKVTVRSDLVGQDVRVWFEDNGIGIAPADMERIFTLFGRLHPASEFEGTGVGLTIVRKAAERMGGKVGVESEPGKGSRFWIQLKKSEDV